MFKRMILLAVSLSLAVLSVSAFSVYDASKLPGVLISIRGDGASDSIVIVTVNSTSETVEYLVPVGEMFINTNASSQDMIAINEYRIVVQPGRRREIRIDAFCIDFNKRIPANNHAFVLEPGTRTVTTGSRILLDYVKQSKYNISIAKSRGVLQRALWFLENGVDSEKTLMHDVDYASLESAYKSDFYGLSSVLSPAQFEAVGILLGFSESSDEEQQNAWEFFNQGNEIHRLALSILGNDIYWMWMDMARSDPDNADRRRRVNELLTAAGIAAKY